MSDHFITNHMIPHDLYETSDLIFKDFSIPRVAIYLLWSLDSLSTSI